MHFRRHLSGGDGVFFEVDPPWVWVEFAGSVIFEVGMP